MSGIRGYGRRLQSVFPPGFDSVPSESTVHSKPYAHSTEQLKGVLIDNYDPMAPSEAIIVKSAWYGKQTNASKHEFILIRVEDKREGTVNVQPMLNYIVLDRNVASKPGKSRKTFKRSQTSVPGGQPTDGFRVSYDGDSDRLFEGCDLHPHRLIEHLEFSVNKPLYLYELAVLAHVVSTKYPNYHTTKSNCYLFAGLIWDSLRKLYPDATHLDPFEWERGKNGLYEFTTTEPQVEAACKSAATEIAKAKEKINGQKAVFEAFVSDRIAAGQHGGVVTAPIQGPVTSG